MSGSHLHESHPAILKRLKRASGHLETVMRMMSAQKECIDVVQQLHAVERAIKAAKETLIHDHIEHCLVHAVRAERVNSQADLAEFKNITKYL
jgi:DNA-binding FrmR family transcriptional regulator